MAEEDEIDILGDFSFNSCLAQNSQGIPSCSDREDTVHPQWLLDSTVTNWYDKEADQSRKSLGRIKKLSGTKSFRRNNESHTSWSKAERDILVAEMAKYGRNLKRIAQTLKTKTEAEVQALIEAEFGVNLEAPVLGLDKDFEHGDIPSVAQEEIVSDDLTYTKDVLSTPPKNQSKPQLTAKTNTKQTKSKNIINLLTVSPSEILYEDELVVGLTESVGEEISSDIIIKAKDTKHKEKAKLTRKKLNHRRKLSRSFDRGKNRNRSRELLKSPQGRLKSSSLSEENAKSPKLQIVLGSGQALPLSEGEQVIKIEKKDSESGSEIEIDVDSGEEGTENKPKPETNQQSPSKHKEEALIAVPLSKFGPLPKRQKKFNLDGGGGYTIMHTEAGDLVAVGAEPRRERTQKKPIHLLQCRYYSVDKPAPCRVQMHVSTLILMDCHAHTSKGEVMGLVGGTFTDKDRSNSSDDVGTVVTISAYEPAASASGHTHCDMDPVSQSEAAERLHSRGLSLVGWHHSHPHFPAAPSLLDLHSQRALQEALESTERPFLGIVTSQHWPSTRARRASQYRCIRVEPDKESPEPVGYQFSVRLLPDITEECLSRLTGELQSVCTQHHAKEYSVDMTGEVCPQAGVTFLEKCLSSISHHMRSAGYEDGDTVFEKTLQIVRYVFR